MGEVLVQFKRKPKTHIFKSYSAFLNDDMPPCYSYSAALGQNVIINKRKMYQFVMF